MAYQQRKQCCSSCGRHRSLPFLSPDSRGSGLICNTCVRQLDREAAKRVRKAAKAVTALARADWEGGFTEGHFLLANDLLRKIRQPMDAYRMGVASALCAKAGLEPDLDLFLRAIDAIDFYGAVTVCEEWIAAKRGAK